MTAFPKGRCPASKNGARCRLEFAHDGNHQAHKDEVTWTRAESDSTMPTIDFGINSILLEHDGPRPETKSFDL